MLVSVICVADRPERLPCLVWSLIAQTHKEWELLVLDQSDDGNVTKHLGSALAASGNRIATERVARVGDWGQSMKEHYAKSWGCGDALMFPSDDAYYMPPALAEMGAALDYGSDLAVCGWVYDIPGYVPMPPAVTVGRVDVGGFMVRRSVFQRIGWPCKEQTGDGYFVEACVSRGANVAFCPSTLYVKN
jgi:hypothetical protein